MHSFAIKRRGTKPPPAYFVVKEQIQLHNFAFIVVNIKRFSAYGEKETLCELITNYLFFWKNIFAIEYIARLIEHKKWAVY